MSDLRLYSWFDVEAALARARHTPSWPDGIISVQVFDDGVVLVVTEPEQRDLAEQQLRTLFGRRYNDQEQAIVLETAAGAEPRVLPVEIEIQAGGVEQRSSARTAATRPSFSRVSVLPDEPKQPNLLPKPFPSDWPLVVAFYSYKGGVGRTLHLVAAMQALSERLKGRSPVLVVDADLEAPGLSWWARAKNGPSAVSFLDLLALVQYSSPEFESAIELVAQRVRQQVLTVKAGGGLTDLFFLSAFRDEEQVFRMPLRPEHLVQKPGQEWVVGKVLAQLGRQLGASAVLVDLRAGVSEMASALLFDPRLLRILVTSTSQQSVEGTKLILRQISKISAEDPSTETYYDPAVIVSMVPQELADIQVPRIIEELLRSYPKYGNQATPIPRLRLESSLFVHELLQLDEFDSSLQKLRGTSPQTLMNTLAAEWIPEETGTGMEVPTPDDKASARARLGETAKNLTYAESGADTDFLRTTPLKALGTAFRYQPPVAVVMGAKGSGKTFAYLRLASSGLWGNFLTELGLVGGSRQTSGSRTFGGSGEPEFRQYVWPLTYPSNLGRSSREVLEHCRKQAASPLGTKPVVGQKVIIDAIRKELRNGVTDESGWRNFWFSLIGRSLGLRNSSEDPEIHILSALAQARMGLVVIVDGLEDLFSDLSVPVQQAALRALFQDVPNALREIPDCQLGLVVFVRKDIARAVLPNNFGQFESLYTRFELKWNAEEALRLAVWVCDKAKLRGKFLNLPEGETVDSAPSQVLEKAMVGVWGLKLGGSKSREAITSSWVRDALSDFNGQLQARDVVRFLHFAAEEARRQPDFPSDARLLQPSAIRQAIIPTSREKVNDIELEIAALKEIFAKFRARSERQIPFTPELFGLTPTEVRFLEEVGIVLEDRDAYYMPEIFRAGLGFTLEGGARPRVISLMRKALGVR